MVEEAQEWVAPGLKGVKVGFGKRGNARLGYEHDRDVAYMRAMREGLGPDAWLMIDCGWNVKWDVTTAVRRVQAFEEYDLDWIEEPLGAWDPEGYANLRSKTTTRIAYGEKEWDLAGFERILATGHGGRRRHRPRPRRGDHRVPACGRRHRSRPPPGQRPCLVVGHLLRGQPGDELQLAGLQALRAQAAAQPDAARPRDPALRARGRLGLPADRPGSRDRGHRRGRRSLSQRARPRGGPAVSFDVGAGLEGRGVIVTGATGGIGAAVAAAFATTGAKVLAVDLDQGAVDDLVGWAGGLGPRRSGRGPA